MRTITNDIPQILIDLAHEAICLGFSRVSIGQGGGSFDTIGSPEWVISLTKIRTERHEGDLMPRQISISLSYRDRKTAPKAFIGTQVTGTDNPYLSLEEIRDWMKMPVLADPANDISLSWEPTLDTAAQTRMLSNWELFHEGVLSGWSMNYLIGWDMLLNMNAINADRGPDTELLTQPVLTLEWRAINNFYNTKDHPANRNNDAPLQVQGWMNTHLDHPRNHETIDMSTTRSPHYVTISREKLTEILGATAPWFVRVKGIRRPEANAWKRSQKGMNEAIADTKRAIAMNAP